MGIAKERQLGFVGGLVVIAFTLTAICSQQSYGASVDDVKRLLDDKLSKYEKNLRPKYNQSEPVYLQVILELASIQEFDEVQQKLTITGVLVLNWFDDFMKWDPSDYGGIGEFITSEDNVWTPNMVLTNTVNNIDKVGDSWQIVRFRADGLAFYYPGDIFSASCQVDVTYYPFDKQTCGFQFNAWGYGGHEIYLIPAGVAQTYFSPNGAWDYLDAESMALFDHSFVTFNLNLKRKPRFIAVNVILPIVLMSALNILIFCIPTESGERVSFCLTVLLSMAVFLTLVGANLPKTSSPMALISFYILAVLLLSICITLATMFSLHLYHKDETEEISENLKRFVMFIRCKCRSRLKSQKRKRTNSGRNERFDNSFQKQNNISTINAVDTIPSEHDNFPNKDRRRDILGSEFYQFDHKRNMYLYNPKGGQWGDRKRSSDPNLDHDISWKDVSIAVDKLFFIFFLIVLVTLTLCFVLIIVLNN